MPSGAFGPEYPHLVLWVWSGRSRFRGADCSGEPSRLWWPSLRSIQADKSTKKLHAGRVHRGTLAPLMAAFASSKFMVETVLAAVAIGVVLLAAWYSCFLQFNHRRGRAVLRWLEQAIAPYGVLGEVTWTGVSSFEAKLHLDAGDFHQPSVRVRLAPRQLAFLWLWWRWRRRQETLTFQANLTCPPGESLEISRYRCKGPARRSSLSRRAETVSTPETQPVATFYLSTQPAWKPLVIERMGTALSMTQFTFLAVSFRTHRPHFSVTFSLSEALRERGRESAIVASVRELAAGSRTSRL